MTLFRYHGVWGPGVRLFRRLAFRSKAAIVSIAFIVPILVLTASLWQSTQEIIDFARKEQTGVTALRSLMPVYEALLMARNATRAGIGGIDTSGDYRAARAKADQAIADLRRSVKASGDPVGIEAAVDKLDQSWQATAQAKNGVDEQGRTVFGPVSESLVAILVKVGQDSNLLLDPDVDSFYLIDALVLSLPDAAEQTGQVWGWSSYALAKGGLPAKDAKRYYAWSTTAAAKLIETRTYIGRATAANPSLVARLNLAPIDAALAFQKQALDAVDDSRGTAQQIYGAGQVATTGLFRVYDGGLTVVDDLLNQRLTRASEARTVRLAVVLVCLLAAGYLFHAFYLVTQGGLDEVRRHLRSMTDGDLTTSPNPWGKDEAAELMFSLRDMQASLRGIVGQVRYSSDSIVHASSEIASASLDLSARTEQTAANLEESASSMEQISSTVRQTADNVREAAQVASNNSAAAARGGAVIAEVMSTMQDINASSSKISDIIGVIDGIAFQTNILALNAAVEAARAGDQGRGFAVVASEVRSLAKRSADAAKEIKLLISTSVDKVNSGSQVVLGAGDTMGELVGNAQRMNDLLADIARAASEQSNGVNQVGTSVTQLDHMTQQNAALVEQTAAAASALKDQALGLATEVARFRLPQGEPA